MRPHSEPPTVAPQARLTLTLRKSAPPLQPAAPVADKPVTAAEPETVPVEAETSFVNWKVGASRPTRRYTNAADAFAEARRLRGLDPDSTIYTYRLMLIREVQP